MEWLIMGDVLNACLIPVSFSSSFIKMDFQAFAEKSYRRYLLGKKGERGREEKEGGQRGMERERERGREGQREKEREHLMDARS